MTPDCQETTPCYCLQCDKQFEHKKGLPCRQTTCPTCGNSLVKLNGYHHKLYIEKKGNKQ